MTAVLNSDEDIALPGRREPDEIAHAAELYKPKEVGSDV
jgi:hypothetical protein